MELTRALVRPPSTTFADGLTRGEFGSPVYSLAKAQHERYCEALERCGLALRFLSVDPAYPDGTFVEDTAILTRRGAILCRPGAESRRGEVATVREALGDLGPPLGEIEAPGTVDGGDVCDAGHYFLIGLSSRTNEEGARQLTTLLSRHGYDSTILDLRELPALLHLKSGLAAIDDGRFVAVPALAAKDELRGHRIIPVANAEAYAANCVSINGHVLIARGFPVLEAALVAAGYDVVTLEMSEFRKMDGGLSCLSLRS